MMIAMQSTHSKASTSQRKRCCYARVLQFVILVADGVDCVALFYVIGRRITLVAAASVAVLARGTHVGAHTHSLDKNRYAAHIFCFVCTATF
jgi:hypothetical protein